MRFYKHLLRPLLFRIPPEAAHRLSHAALRTPLFWEACRPFLAYQSSRLQLKMGNLTLPNPVGLAAGWDKDCTSMKALSNLGFGYIVGGTVTPEPRPGNHKPRLIREPKQQATINSLGFPNSGANNIVQKLERIKRRNGEAPLLVSIAADDVPGFCHCLEILQPLVDGVEINISSPNTPGLRTFHDPRIFDALLNELCIRRVKPLFVKLPPYMSEKERQTILQLVNICLSHNIQGVTISNTHPVRDTRLAVGTGGLSGKPLLEHTLRTVQNVRSLAGSKLVINASGGIFDGIDTLAAIQSGADTVQIMTALWYHGPSTVGNINRYLDNYLIQNNLSSIHDLRQTETPHPPP